MLCHLPTRSLTLAPLDDDPAPAPDLISLTGLLEAGAAALGVPDEPGPLLNSAGVGARNCPVNPACSDRSNSAPTTAPFASSLRSSHSNSVRLSAGPSTVTRTVRMPVFWVIELTSGKRSSSSSMSDLLGLSKSAETTKASIMGMGLGVAEAMA